MPHVVGLILIGAGLYAGCRAMLRIAHRVREDFERAQADAAQPVVVEKDLGVLEYDATSGVYLPRRRG